jgi:mycothiol synthase
MNISIREFSPSDYPHLACIHNANYPQRPRTADAFVEVDKNRNLKCRAQRWVACAGERVIGYGAYDQDIYDFHPQRFYILGAVLPEYQRLGVGARLFEQIMAGLHGFDPRVLRANAYSTCPAGLSFLEQRGFCEVWRETPCQLDVTVFDSSPYAELEERLRREGFEIKTLRELENDPDRDRKAYDLYWHVYDTMPREESDVTHMDFDDWITSMMAENPIAPEAYLIATRAGEYTGFKELCTDTSDDHALQGGLLGVKPEYRRRGIALALQVRANIYARDHGYRLIKSSTGASHTAMQAMFARLGYVHLYDWYQMEKRL